MIVEQLLSELRHRFLAFSAQRDIPKLSTNFKQNSYIIVFDKCLLIEYTLRETFSGIKFTIPIRYYY